VLLWHAVGEGSQDVYDVPPAEFDGELALLERWGAKAITLDALFDALDGKAALPDHAVVLTFDDGRACLHSQALPLLQKHHQVAEAFVVTGGLSADDAHRLHFTDATGTHPYLTWPELRAMVASGAFVAESHSVSHQRLPDLSPSTQLSQMRDSAKVLRDTLKVPAHFLAYPYGSNTLFTQWLAWRAGYRGAVSVDARGPYRYAVPRFSLHRGGEDKLKTYLTQLWGPLPQ
jgi:peptidoglycan/xylan/chitin deacetylase (PgdA/CDA1 family)